MILLYHQVCDRRTDPWKMAVHPDKFEEQLRVLKDSFNIISMEELVHGLRGGVVPKNSVVITFDDGFADTYTNAVPLLEWYRLPASFYLSTGFIRVPRYYWWDELQSLILHPTHLPMTLDQKIGTTRFQYTLRRSRVLTPRQSYQISTWTQGMRVENERVDLYLRLHDSVRPLPVKQREGVLQVLGEWARINHVSCRYAPMQRYQVLQISREAMFHIGAHTVNHRMLGAIEEEDIQRAEISGSKQDVEEMVQREVCGFAYPYGSYNATTRRLIETIGFDHAVSTETGVVTRDSDRYALPRLPVWNWSGEQLRFHIRQLMNAG